jgi:hypothetical protein
VNKRSRKPVRSAAEIGPGDFVKLGPGWHEVETNEIFGRSFNDEPHFKRGDWEIKTKDGRVVNGWAVGAYAKAEDMENA